MRDWRGPVRSRRKQHADGLRHGDDTAGGGQAAGAGIDLEGDEVVAVLVGADQPLAVGRELEIARVLAAAGRDLHQLERAVGLDREDRDALVAAVGGVEGLSVSTDCDLRRRKTKRSKSEWREVGCENR